MTSEDVHDSDCKSRIGLILLSMFEVLLGVALAFGQIFAGFYLKLVVGDLILVDIFVGFAVCCLLFAASGVFVAVNTDSRYMLHVLWSFKVCSGFFLLVVAFAYFGCGGSLFLRPRNSTTIEESIGNLTTDHNMSQTMIGGIEIGLGIILILIFALYLLLCVYSSRTFKISKMDARRLKVPAYGFCGFKLWNAVMAISFILFLIALVQFMGGLLIAYSVRSFMWVTILISGFLSLLFSVGLFLGAATQDRCILTKWLFFEFVLIVVSYCIALAFTGHGTLILTGMVDADPLPETMLGLAISQYNSADGVAFGYFMIGCGLISLVASVIKTRFWSIVLRACQFHGTDED